MKWSLKLVAIGCFAALTIAPAQAAVSEAEQATLWRYQLHRSYCAGNWTEAISLAGAMMGNRTVRQHERVWLFLLRQDMFNFQSGAAAFPGCQGGRVLAGITAEAAEIASQPAESSLSWEKGLAAIGVSAATARQSVSPPANPSRFVATTPAQNTNCTRSAGERWVADGSTSNQWNYEIWQDTSRRFYVKYWQQGETCAQSRETTQYATQNEAWQEFRSQVGL